MQISENLIHRDCGAALMSPLYRATYGGQTDCLLFALQHISILMFPYFIISFIWKSETISQNSARSYRPNYLPAFSALLKYKFPSLFAFI